MIRAAIRTFLLALTAAGVASCDDPDALDAAPQGDEESELRGGGLPPPPPPPPPCEEEDPELCPLLPSAEEAAEFCPDLPATSNKQWVVIWVPMPYPFPPIEVLCLVPLPPPNIGMGGIP